MPIKVRNLAAAPLAKIVTLSITATPTATAAKVLRNKSLVDNAATPTATTAINLLYRVFIVIVATPTAVAAID